MSGRSPGGMTSGHVKDCSCARWEEGSTSHTSSFPVAQFETLECVVDGDYHGATPHHGRLRCVHCGATFAYVSSLTATTVTRE